MSPPSASVALDTLLSPLGDCLDDLSARAILALRADPKAQVRIAELAERANEGQLTDAERAEYESCVWAGNFIGILQAKARSRFAAWRRR